MKIIKSFCNHLERLCTFALHSPNENDKAMLITMLKMI